MNVFKKKKKKEAITVKPYLWCLECCISHLCGGSCEYLGLGQTKVKYFRSEMLVNLGTHIMGMIDS